MTIEKDCKVTPDQIMDILEADNIESRPIWKPMHLQPVYASRDFFTKDGLNQKVSIGEDIFTRGLCLPSDIKNTKEDMDKIIHIIRNLF